MTALMSALPQKPTLRFGAERSEAKWSDLLVQSYMNVGSLNIKLNFRNDSIKK